MRSVLLLLLTTLSSKHKNEKKKQTKKQEKKKHQTRCVGSYMSFTFCPCQPQTWHRAMFSGFSSELGNANTEGSLALLLDTKSGSPHRLPASAAKHEWGFHTEG